LHFLQAEHDGSDIQTRMNVEHHHDQDILPNMKRSPHVKYITYYEDGESIPGWRTAVWELDKGAHLEPIFLIHIILWLLCFSLLFSSRYYCIAFLQGSP
jgi:hypothetical protein